MKPTKKALAAGVSLTLAFGMAAPLPALATENDQEIERAAEENGDTQTLDAEAGSAVVSGESAAVESVTEDAVVPDGLPESSYNKADFYVEEGGVSAAPMRAMRAATIQPRTISADMLYFGAYEGGSYDATFGYGDGYHAMGYYQFDHRYGLQNFLLACYSYNPSKYSMFAQFGNVSSNQFKAEDAIRQNGAFTTLGTNLINAWKAAYAADPYEFARLQDDWAYTSYYLPAERYMASIGIDISDRSDAVKGLCWGMSNLFGTSGWKKFVGGVSDGYDWSGVYHYLSEGYQWPGAGLTDDMTDTEFVTTLCDYVVNNVAVFYKGQPQYHQGWQNRYVKEKAKCLEIINRTGDTHAKPVMPTPAPTPEPEGPSMPSNPDDGSNSNGSGSGDSGSNDSGSDDSGFGDVPGDSSSNGASGGGDNGGTEGGNGGAGADDPSNGDNANGGNGSNGGDSGFNSGDASNDGTDNGSNDSSAGGNDGSNNDNTAGDDNTASDGSNQTPPPSNGGLTGDDASNGDSSGDGTSNDAPSDDSGSTSNDQGGADGSDGASGTASGTNDVSAADQDNASKDSVTDGKTTVSGDGVKTASDQNSGADKANEKSLPTTNDGSAGIVAVLVGGFALAFGIASGTLRRILGRNL